jgi:2-haloacid dehalogenase
MTSSAAMDRSPPRPPIQAVVFDLGGVLLDWNPRHLYRKLFADEAEMERFLAEVCTMAWHDAHDRGLPPHEGCAKLSDAHPEYQAEIMAWAQRSEEMIAGPIHGTVQLLDELRARGVHCYALTNMEAETYPLRRAHFEFLGWFDGTVVSGHERVAKPDPEIFTLLLGRFGLVPETTVMIDDSPRNLEAARALGLQTVCFQSPGQLRAWLVEAGLVDPEPPEPHTDPLNHQLSERGLDT